MLRKRPAFAPFLPVSGRFNEAGAVMLRKSRIGDSIHNTAVSFNEAGAVMLRKRFRNILYVKEQALASMRPEQ